MMFGHPVSLTGWIIFSIGFGMLVIWVPTSVGNSSGFGQADFAVYNAHKAEISKAVMLFGGILAIIGVIAQGFGMNSAMSVVKDVDASNLVPQAKATGPEGEVIEVKQIIDRQGKHRNASIFSNGTVSVETLTGTRNFPNFQSAQDYFS